jgi:hypothetical protein
MGLPTPHPPVYIILAAFSRYEAALDWATEKVTATWGSIVLASPRFEFHETSYYEQTMGSGIRKQFLLCEQPRDPAELSAMKLLSNAWEDEYAALANMPEPRPLNIDPGYITLGKLVLASTKDFAHRIYLGQGIYAEVTLHYRHHRWQHHDFTFPDYRRDDYQKFFSECRAFVHRKLRRTDESQDL